MSAEPAQAPPAPAAVTPPPAPRSPAPRRPVLPPPVPLGRARVHPVTRDEARLLVAAWADDGAPAVVVTPNVDHLVLLEKDEHLRAAYDEARLQLCDGMPLLLLARLSRTPLPERVTGADLFLDVCEEAAARGQKLFIAGGMPDVLETGIAALRARYPGLAVEGHSPPRAFEGTAAEDELVRRIGDAAPDVVMVCLGAPRAEIWAAHQVRRHAAVYLCVGAAIDFVAGARSRAPSWMQAVGLEWLYRLAQEPARLGHRYLVRDRAIVGIALRQLRGRR